MRTKSILLVTLMGLVPAAVLAGLPPKEVSEKLKDAGNSAITRLVERFVKEDWGDRHKSFVILPIPGDIERDYFSQRLQDEFARLGRTAGYDLYTRQDEDAAALIDEVVMGIEKGDLMDRDTIAKFGVIGADAIILTRVDYSSSADGETLRFNLEPYVVETRQRLAGGEEKAFVAAPAAPPPPRTPWWVILGAGLGGLLVLIVVLRWIYSASRPR
jgi:hypothetical protein